MKNVTEIFSPGKIQEGAKDMAEAFVKIAAFTYLLRYRKILEEFAPEEFGPKAHSHSPEVTIYTLHATGHDMPPQPRIDKSTM